MELSITFHSLSIQLETINIHGGHLVQKSEWFRVFLKTYVCVHLDRIWFSGNICQNIIFQIHIILMSHIMSVTYCHVHNWQKIKNMYTVSALPEYQLFINITCASLSINKPFNESIVEFFHCIYHYTLALLLVGIFQRSNNTEGLSQCWDWSLLSANLLFSI